MSRATRQRLAQRVPRMVSNGLPPGLPPQSALPQVLIQVVGPQQLSVQSNIPGPGAWPQILSLLLTAAQTALAEQQKEAQAAGAQRRIVVPKGVVVPG